MSFAPIALFVYKRIDVLEKTVEALKSNKLANESELFIFSDGGKNNEDWEKVNKVREYLKTIDGFKKIKIIENPTNKGLANSLIDGVSKIVDEYGKIIVVEDDIVTSPYFLSYMNDALDMYENDKEVACISGYAYPIKGKVPQSFFIKGAECWGWATWKASWDLFEKDGQKLLNEIRAKKLEREFNFDNSYPFLQMLKNQINGKNNSWAIRWVASAFLQDKLCLYLSQSLVQNIGFIDDATHCAATNIFDVELNKEPIKLEKIEPQENKKARKYLEKFYSTTSNMKQGNFLFRREKDENKRNIIILGFIKFSYRKKRGGINNYGD